MNMKPLSFFCATCILALLLAASVSCSAPATWTDPLSGMEFVWIDGGCVELGMTVAEEQALRAAIPERFFTKNYGDEVRRRACPDGFWLATREVTQAQWAAVTGTQGHACAGGRGPDLPATWITWDEATQFARALSAEHNGTEAFALASEAQWEHACRQQARSNIGLVGMTGGPEEWVANFYTRNGTDPDVEAPADPRVVKGDRCSDRRGAVPGHVNCNLGFRLVRLAPGPQ